MNDMDSMLYFECGGDLNSSDNDETEQQQQQQQQQFTKQEIHKISRPLRHSFDNNQPSSLSSSVSSTTSSYLSISTSTPSTNNYLSNFNNFSPNTTDYQSSSSSSQDFYNQMWKYASSSTSLSSNNLTENVNNLVANLAAVYNPYLVMNLMQNQQNMNALQTAAANFKTTTTSTTTMTTPVIKRKTHLSNCFMQDLSKEGRFQAIDDELEFNSYLYDATNNSNSSSILLQKKQNAGLINQQLKNQENKQPLPLPQRKAKINFGDISELIN